MLCPENVAKYHHYHSFGFNIASEIKLPELRPGDIRSGDWPGSTDVVISKRSLENLWHQMKSDHEYTAFGEGIVLLRIPGTAIFGMEDGNMIWVSPYPQADENKIRLYLLGSCMGVILMQRRILPLHGSALAIEGRAYAIVGASGAGKSTLSSYLLQHGHGLLSDDLIAVFESEQESPVVMPAYPQQKIWQESMQLLGKSTAGLQPLFERETKFAVPVASQFCDKSMPLAGIFELVKGSEDAAIAPLEGLERFHALLRHTFRGFLLQPLGLLEWHFRTISKFSGHLDMYRISRPIDKDSLEELHRFVHQSIYKEMFS